MRFTRFSTIVKAFWLTVDFDAVDVDDDALEGHRFDGHHFLDEDVGHRRLGLADLPAGQNQSINHRFMTTDQLTPEPSIQIDLLDSKTSSPIFLFTLRITKLKSNQTKPNLT